MGEIWRSSQRGQSLAVLSTVTLLGPCIGPIIGALIAERSASSWRWAFWATVIFNAFLQIPCFHFLHESHAPTILAKQIKRENIRRQPSQDHNTLKRIRQALQRPFFLLISQPASLGLVIYAGFQFGTLYIMLSTVISPRERV